MAIKVSEKSTKSESWAEYQRSVDAAHAQPEDMAVTVIEANRPISVTSAQA
ncbi:MAG: hypothetical protein WAQ24_03840 [Candidatus Saccharimonadales bacterium]